MRIHVLAQEINRSGGAGVHTAELVRQLSARGHDLTLICHAADAEHHAHGKIEIVPRTRLASRPIIWRFALPLRLAGDWLRPGFDNLVEPDAVIASDLPLWMRHRRRFARRPAIYLPHALVASIEVRGYSGQTRLQRWLAEAVYSRLERRALEMAQCTIRFTETACDEMRRYYGSDLRANFAVLPPPVHIPEDRPGVREPGPMRLLSLGRLVESKNVSLLLDVLRGLANLNWQLDIVGDGEKRPALGAQARESGLSDRVHFHGHRSDVDRFYTRADLFLLPSRLENAPLVMLEAMSHQLPVLAIRADGTTYRNAFHEMAEHGRTAFLANDEADFGETLARLLRDPSALPAIGNEARQTVVQRHTWAAYIDRVEEILARISQTTTIRLSR